MPHPGFYGILLKILYFFLKLQLFYGDGGERVSHSTCVEFRGQLLGAGSFFAPRGTWDLNSSQQAWCQAPLPADPSPGPGVCFVVRSRGYLVGLFSGLCQLLF